MYVLLERRVVLDRPYSKLLYNFNKSFYLLLTDTFYSMRNALCCRCYRLFCISATSNKSRNDSKGERYVPNYNGVQP